MSNILKGLNTKKTLREGISQEDLANTLFNRLEYRYPDIVSRYGHEVVGDAVMNVADFHAGAEELGSSDISIMLRQILKYLEDYALDEAVGDTYLDPETALYQARKITKQFKYADMHIDIIMQLQQLAEKSGIDPRELQYQIDEVYEKQRELESAIYALDEVFEDNVRNKQYADDVDEGQIYSTGGGAGQAMRWYTPKDNLGEGEEMSENLRKWFKEKWVRFGPDGKIRGDCARGDDSEGKPKCLPQSKAHSLGKKGRASAAARKRREDPNPERRGPAKNVATKKKSNEGVEQSLSLQQLATISDEALDNAYHYGRSSPGNTFGWQANLKSAAYAKQMIDKGVTDIEAISDAIHKGWNVTAKAFVQNPDQFDDTEKLKAAGKLEAKLQQRAQLMKQNYAQLPDEEKEKDRVVARALLQAIKGQQGVAEAELDEACWKGYHKEGNKKMFGKTYPNCVKNTNEGVAEAVKKPNATTRHLRDYPVSDKDVAKPVKKPEKKKPEQGVAEGSEKNVIKSIKVGNFRHDLVDTGMGWQVRIYNGDELHDTGMSKNSEQKGLAALEDAVAYTEKQTRTKRQGVAEDQLDEKCWDTHKQVGMKSKGGKMVPNCVPKESVEEDQAPMFTPESKCPHCGGKLFEFSMMNEKKDACYYKVKSRYKVWPSAYASGALVKCRKKGASNWGTGGKKNEGMVMGVSSDASSAGSKVQGEAANPAQQAAIAIAMKKAGQKPKRESAIMKGLVDETLGTPYPSTYEQETSMIKRKGPQRITAMTYENKQGRK